MKRKAQKASGDDVPRNVEKPATTDSNIQQMTAEQRREQEIAAANVIADRWCAEYRARKQQKLVEMYRDARAVGAQSRMPNPHRDPTLPAARQLRDEASAAAAVADQTSR